MIRSHLQRGDVLLSIVGTVGSVGIYSSDSPATCSCKLAILRPKEVTSGYLAAFLLSKHGNNQIKKFVRGAVQTGFILEDASQINIPIFTSEFQKQIENVVKAAHGNLKQSKRLYAEAESLLLNELGLRDWQPTEENTAVKSFKESFLASGRLDAEFYQPKYDELLKQLKTVETRANWTLKTIACLSEPLRYGSSTKLEYLESGVPFLRIADVRQFRFDAENLKYISEMDAKEESYTSVKTDDVIISRSGTLGLSVTIPQELNGSIFGSYFIRVRPKDEINPHYLSLFMNSKAGQLQVEQANTGGIQTNLTIPAIESLLIALPPKEVQNELVQMVFDSFHAQDESKRLLETAKRGVEIAIERDEQAALEWIDDTTHLLR